MSSAVTLALRRGARMTVDAAEWRDAFGTVTSGRVQLELRDGRPGPVLGRDAGFGLAGTGVRALLNPGRATARVCVFTPGPWDVWQRRVSRDLPPEIADDAGNVAQWAMSTKRE